MKIKHRSRKGKRPNDYIFWPEVTDPQERNKLMNDQWEQICKILETISPEKAYASRKTGRIVTEENMHLLTAGELKEWSDAVEEYWATR